MGKTSPLLKRHKHKSATKHSKSKKKVDNGIPFGEEDDMHTHKDKLSKTNKRRKTKQGLRDSNEHDHAVSKFASMSEEDDGGDGKGSVSECRLGYYAEGDVRREHDLYDITKQSNEDGAGDGDEASSEDDANDCRSNSHTNVDEIASTSSFHRHVGHIVTNEEADKLVKSKWQYKWEIPATGMIMSKWAGTGECLSKDVTQDLVCAINPKLYKHWVDIYMASGNGDFDSRLRNFFPLCNTYRDIMHCDKKPFYLKGVHEDSCIMDAYLMHALNHVFKSRDLVVKNDTKLSKHQEGETDILHGGTFLDQGFTRPKVLRSLTWSAG